MNKAQLLALANKGKTEINGIPLEVIERPDSDGDMWLEIKVDPLSPLHQPLILGNKWTEYITDEECEELPEALLQYKKEAEEFCEKAKTVVKAKLNGDGSYSFTEVPEKVQENLKDYPSALKQWLREKKHIVFINDNKKEWRAPGKFTLELDGVRYEPHWSYWLNCTYYEADDFIRKAVG